MVLARYREVETAEERPVLVHGLRRGPCRSFFIPSVCFCHHLDGCPDVSVHVILVAPGGRADAGLDVDGREIAVVVPGFAVKGFPRHEAVAIIHRRVVGEERVEEADELQDDHHVVVSGILASVYQRRPAGVEVPLLLEVLRVVEVRVEGGQQVSMSGCAASAGDRDSSSLTFAVSRNARLAMGRVREGILDEDVLRGRVVGDRPIQDALAPEVASRCCCFFPAEERVMELDRRVLDWLSHALFATG